MDRRLKLGSGIALGSAVLLAVALIVILTGLGRGGGLPHQGNLTDIIASGSATPAPGVAQQGGPPPPAPTRFLIPGLYIDAPVIPEGKDADNYPQVPDRPDQVAWYPFTSSPGQSSNAVFSGHVDWQTPRGDPIAGVFYRLREMKIGDIIQVALDNGTKLQYRVTGNVATPYDDPNIVKVFDPTNRDVITIITCGGTWVRDPSQEFGGNYSHRIIVRAERVQGLASDQPAGQPGG